MEEKNSYYVHTHHLYFICDWVYTVASRIQSQSIAWHVSLLRDKRLWFFNSLCFIYGENFKEGDEVVGVFEGVELRISLHFLMLNLLQSTNYCITLGQKTPTTNEARRRALLLPTKCLCNGGMSASFKFLSSFSVWSSGIGTFS